MKETIKKIPIIGFVARWFYNLLRLNNLKFRVMVLEEESRSLRKRCKELQEQSSSFASQLQEQEQKLPTLIAKEIFYQSLSLQQRVDQFIFDANIELKAKITKENE